MLTRFRSLMHRSLAKKPELKVAHTHSHAHTQTSCIYRLSVLGVKAIPACSAELETGTKLHDGQSQTESERGRRWIKKEWMGRGVRGKENNQAGEKVQVVHVRDVMILACLILYYIQNQSIKV